MNKITIYKTPVCPYCVAATNFLQNKGVDVNSIDYIDIIQSPEKKEEMVAKTNKQTVPQIFINDTYMGGFDDLMAAASSGKLDEILK